MELGSVTERLARNYYETDTASHIEVNQAAIKAAGVGPMLVRICPAKVYTLATDGTLGVTHAACLECGTCRQLAPAGALTWHYPASGMGVTYRQG